MLQERPCQRCIKRNIGHLCHDEPRDTPHRKSKGGDTDPASADEPLSPKNDHNGRASADNNDQSVMEANNVDLKPSAVDNMPVSDQAAIKQPIALAEAVQQGRENSDWAYRSG